jgi:prevent-host-death family protein
VSHLRRSWTALANEWLKGYLSDRMEGHFAMKSWPAQDARARFSELLDACLAEGPQMVTRRGKEAVGLLPVADRRRLNERVRPGLKELLLAPYPRGDFSIPPRGRLRRRRPERLR